MSSSSVASSSVVEPRPIRLLDNNSSLHSLSTSSAGGPSPPSPSASDPLLQSALSEPKSRSLLLSCEDELLSLLSAHSTAHSYTIHDVSSFQRMLLTRLGRRWGFELRNAHDAEAAGESGERRAGGEEHDELNGGSAGGGSEDSLTFIRTAQSRPPPQLLSQLAKLTESEERLARNRSPAAAQSASASASSSPASLKIMQRASSTEPGPASSRTVEAALAMGASAAAADSDVDEEAAIRQREEEYERIRARIFGDEPDDDVWRSVSIRKESEQLLSDAAGASTVGESAAGDGSTDSGRLRDEAAKKKSMALLARLDSTAGDDSRSKKVGSGVEAADMHLYNRRLYPTAAKAMTPYSLPFYPSSAFQPSYSAAAFSPPQYYPTSQQYLSSTPLPQPSTAALNTADLTVQAAISKLRQQQATDSSVISPLSPAASRPSSSSSVTSPTLSSSAAATPPTILTQAQRAAGFVDVATLQQMNANAPVFTPSYAKPHNAHSPHYTNRGMAAMPAGMQFVSPQPALSSLPPAAAAAALPYPASPYAAVSSSSPQPQLPQGFRAVRTSNPSASLYTRNAGGYHSGYTSQSSTLPTGTPYQPLSGSAYGYQYHSFNQSQQSQQQPRPSAVSPSNIGAIEPSQRSPSLESGSSYPMYINTFPSSSSLSPSSQSRPQPSSSSPSPIGPPSASASSIRSRALSLPTSSDPILEQPLPSRRYSHVIDGNVASLSALSLSSSSSPTVSSPSFSSANDPIVQPSTLSASSLSSPTNIQQQQQQQKQHTLFSSPTAASSPFSPFSFQSSPFLSSASSDQVTGAPLFSLTPTANSLTSPMEQRRDASEPDRRKEVARKEDGTSMSAAVSPLRSSPASPNSAGGPLDVVVFRSAPKLFISNSNGPTAQQQMAAADSPTDSKGSRDDTSIVTAGGKDNGSARAAAEGDEERVSGVRETPYVSAPSIRITSPSASPPPTVISKPVITIYPSSMQPGARKAPPASASPSSSTTSSSSSVASPPAASVSFASMVRHSLNKPAATPATAAGTAAASTVGHSAVLSTASTSPTASSSSSASSSSTSAASPSAASASIIHKNPLITIRPSAWSQGPAAVAHIKAAPTASSSSSTLYAAASSADSDSVSSASPSASSPSDPVWTAVGGGGRRK